MREFSKKVSGILATASMVAGMVGVTPVSAADNLDTLSDTMSQIEVSATAEHIITFTTSDTSSTKVEINFGATGITGMADVVAGDVTIGGGAADSVGTSATSIIVTDSELGTAGAHTIVIADGVLTNPADPAINVQLVLTTKTDADATVETGEIGLVFIANDDVYISGTVNPTLTFTIDDADGVIGFGDLSTSNSRYATGDATGSNTSTSAHTMTAKTNATGGYIVYVKGKTLYSVDDTSDFITSGDDTTPVAPDAGNQELFGMYVAQSGGTGTLDVAAPYDTEGSFGFTPDPSVGTALDEVATSANATDTVTYTVSYATDITGVTEAGLYETTLTFICTGRF